MSRLEELIEELCPDGVEYHTLDKLGKIYGGLTGKSKDDFIDGNAKFISYKNVYTNPSLSLEYDDYVKISLDENQRILEYGDVLFTGSSETPNECGISSVLTTKTEENIYLNSFCFIFRFNDRSIMLPDFSKHLFRSKNLRYQIGKTANGVTRFNISKKLMGKVVIPVPPLPVQEEIVRILDHFTELTEELTEELAARKKQYEYYRMELLGYGNKNNKWVQLSDVGKISMCKRIMKSETTATGEVPFFKIGTFGREPNAYISKEIFEKYKSMYSYPKKGDILISAAGTIGRIVVFDGNPAYFQDSNIVWIDNDEKIILNSFLKYFYQLQPWKVSTGGTIARLYNDNISNTKVPVLSIPEQKRIVEILDRFDTLCNDITTGLPAEIEARQKQYEYYRDKLLTFKELS